MKYSGFKTGPIREEAWRNSAPEVQWTSGVPDTEVHYRAHRKFFLRPGGALHMYMALQLFNLHLRCALLQFNFLSVFTSYEHTLKIHIVPMEAQKNLEPPRVY